MAWKKKVLERIDKAISNFILKLMDIHKDFRKYRFFEYFEQRDDDVYVITFFKSGTTWMQMILYQMLSEDGAVDFDHIYDVSPWATNEATINGDPTRINSLPSPRIIKTHEPYDNFDPKFKGKFVFVYRDGRDVAVSLYHHRKNYNNPNETLDESFANHFSPEEEYNWFTFTNIWMRNDNAFNILYVNYANLKLNFDEELDRIAKFLEIDLDEEKRKRVKERSSFEFMKEHETKFGEQPKAKERRVYNQFIRKGEIGEGEKLSEEQKATFSKMYDKYVKKYESKFKLRA